MKEVSAVQTFPCNLGKLVKQEEGVVAIHTDDQKCTMVKQIKMYWQSVFESRAQRSKQPGR
eukprot:1160249-Pelagomonas_calceolata.AAC.1